MVSKILYGLFIALLISVVGLFLMTALPIPGNVAMKIVQSGSMEPAIMTGSIVVVYPASSYGINDVITFTSSSANVPTTHRIVALKGEGGNIFVTKGDANEEADTETTIRADILGKVVLSVPYVGYILDFARKPLGFMLLIALPALLIVIDEIEKIWKEMRRIRKPKVTEKKEVVHVAESNTAMRTRVRMMDINRPAFARVQEIPVAESLAPTTTRPVASVNHHYVLTSCVVVALITFVSNSWSIGGTVSYFSDTEKTIENLLHAVALDFTAIPDSTTFTFTEDGVLNDPDGLITLVAPEVGSVALKHRVAVAVSSGNPVFCDAITATTISPFVYSGPLSALSATDVSFSGPWTLELNLESDSYLPDDQCIVDIIYSAWNASLTDGSSRYVDEERVQLTFTAPTPLASILPFSQLLQSTSESTVFGIEDEIPEQETVDFEEGIFEEETSEEVILEEESFQNENEEDKDKDKDKDQEREREQELEHEDTNEINADQDILDEEADQPDDLNDNLPEDTEDINEE